MRVPLVGWEKVCVSKCEGGLGIRNSYAWNLAAICKLSWWIYTKPDSLWVQWVHHVYMKGVHWHVYTPKTDTPWSWKTIYRVRQKFEMAFSPSGQWLPGSHDYTPASGYNWIRKKQPVVTWVHTKWNSCSVPKHMFINWLITREALLLKDRLFQIGVSTDADCCLCGAATETHVHLFSQCVYTRRLMQLLSSKLKISLPAVNLLGWISSKSWPKVKKWVTIAWIQAVYYTIWIQRNCARLNGCIMHPDAVIQQISSILNLRTMYWLKCTKRVSDETWIKSIKYD
ncbi:uncharacterized protein LOC141588150 [Silene latifolia]|uniref:uncharacterized protein LOC141588150 n=1 Tax=Silene latifolia TaxID=37657 RepID=UPI003D7774BC